MTKSIKRFGGRGDAGHLSSTGARLQMPPGCSEPLQESCFTRAQKHRFREKCSSGRTSPSWIILDHIPLGFGDPQGQRWKWMHRDQLLRGCGFSSLEIPQCHQDVVLGTLLCMALMGPCGTRGTRRSLTSQPLWDAEVPTVFLLPIALQSPSPPGSVCRGFEVASGHFFPPKINKFHLARTSRGAAYPAANEMSQWLLLGSQKQEENQRLLMDTRSDV